MAMVKDIEETLARKFFASDHEQFAADLKFRLHTMQSRIDDSPTIQEVREQFESMVIKVNK